MPIVWPSSLDAALLYGWTEGFPNRVIRTQTDSGPVKVRQRYTAGVRPLAIPVALTDAQAATLDSFFDSDTSGGSLRFEWQHPRTGATHEMRFIEPPQLTGDRGLHRGTLKVEILP